MMIMMIISSDNGLTPKRWQAVIWTNDSLVYWLIYLALGLNELRDISIKIYAFFNQLKLFENVACQQQPYLFSLFTLYTYIYILFVWRKHENMSPYTGIEVNMSELFHVLDPTFERGSQHLKTTSATHYYAECPNHSAMTHPSKWIGISHRLSHT